MYDGSEEWESVCFLCWCFWLGIRRTVAGAGARNQPTPPEGSHACICASWVQRSIWFIPCIRRWTLIYLSSVVWKFSNFQSETPNIRFREAFGCQSFATNPAIWDPPLLICRKEETGGFDFRLSKPPAPLCCGKPLEETQPRPWVKSLALVHRFQSGSIDEVKIIPVLTVHPSHFSPLCPLGSVTSWRSRILRFNVVTDKKLVEKGKDEQNV